MKRLSFLVSLTNNDNDYQQEQAAAAEKAARRLGVDVKIIHANNDAVAQSQQLLEYVQGSQGARPDAILFEPAGGTAFPQVARAAAAAGIGWVVLNHEVDYVSELRRQFKVPICAISSDHQEVGKIQGQQFAALLPNGGSLLYIEGPANSSAAKERTAGMMKTKPANIQVKSMRANWTEESAYKTVSSWLRLRTSLESKVDLVGAQDDSMAMGARKAFSEIPEADRARWMKVPITGCDGMPKTGQAWVRNGTLAATIFIRPNTDLAIEMLVEAFKSGTALPDSKVTAPESVPALADLAIAGKKVAKSAKA
jgi:ribose transport system substrate-binding protein